MQGYRYTDHTHAPFRQLQKLSELADEFGVTNTATLVSSYNKTKNNHKQHDVLLSWIEKYIPFFEKMTHSECCHRAMEFVQLANIIPESARSKELLKDAFCCLCTKISRGDYGDDKLLQALSQFLLSVDHKVFERNPRHLTRVARDVIQKLGHEETFSRGTYPTHSVSLLTLHHLYVVIHAVDPIEFDHDKPTGLYQEMNRCLENIIESQTYYPIYYQARLTQQSLANVDSNPGVSSKERRYRIFCAFKGTMYIFQALAGVVSANIDIENLEKGVSLWIKARTSRSIEQSSWYENAKPLIDARIVVQNDPKKLETFQKCFMKINEIQKKTKIKQNQIALRYTMIRQVTLMALHSPSTWVREWSTEKLVCFGSHYVTKKKWAKDSTILEAVLEAMLEVHQKHGVEFRMDQVVQKIRLYARTKEQTKTIKNWEEVIEWKQADKEAPKLDGNKVGNSLFQRIKKELSFDESISALVAIHERLKERYKQHSEVPSLFDNEARKHVKSLAHSLRVHDKVLSQDGKIDVVKTPIALEDLFKDRVLVPGGSFKKVKRVLLFGNPGTGKTTVAKKIAYKWSVDELGDVFDMLYLVPVRELGCIVYDDLSSRTRRNVQTAITNICFPGEDDPTFEALRLQVEHELDKERTLVVFDGLDEGDEYAKELIKYVESKFCRVMVLSRPQDLQSERNIADLEVECLGLNDEQLVNFIEAESSSTDIVEHLRSRPDIWEISHTPVVANILVFLYKTCQEDVILEESCLNMCSLYWNMSDGIWTRFVEKSNNDIQRDVIFETLAKIAFHALKDGQILIGQQLVRDHSHHPQMKHVLKDCGFLLLKRKGFYYQFPHLTFQEFFAGQHMAHTLMGIDEERKKDAIDFFAENKYCANFRQVFRFMVQAFIEKKHDKGYFEVESLVNAKPIALGYQQHLLLHLELLEDSLSASKQQDRASILNSTKVLEIALKWTTDLMQDDFEILDNPKLQFRNADSFISIVDMKMDEDQLLDLFAKVAKVTRYVADQWEEIMEILKQQASDFDDHGLVHRVVTFMRVVPEEKENLLALYWTFLENKDDGYRMAAVHKFVDVARLFPNASEQIFKTYKSMFIEGKPQMVDTLLTVGPGLAKLMHDRRQDILELMIEHSNKLIGGRASHFMWSILDFVDNVPESASTVMKIIREWSVSDDERRSSVASCCGHRINALKQNTKDVAEILWTLCEDGIDDVCNEAKKGLVKAMVSWGDTSNPGVNALLTFCGNEQHTSRSSLVRLVAIAYKWIEETQEGVNHLLTTLSKQEIEKGYDMVARYIVHSVRTKSEGITEVYRLHLMCLKALHPEVFEENGLLLRTDIFGFIPNEVALMSIKLIRIYAGQVRCLTPEALCQFAANYPELEDDVFSTLDELIFDDDDFVAWNACIQIIAVLGKMPQKAEKTLARCQELMEKLGSLGTVQEMMRLPLDSLLNAYFRCHNNFLVPFIIWKLFDTPATMETGRNGEIQLIVQTSTNSKKRYTFETSKEAEAFMPLVKKCTERRFSIVASSIPELDVQDTEQSIMYILRGLWDRFIELIERIFGSG